MKTFVFACLLMLLSPVCSAQEPDAGQVTIAINPEEENIKEIGFSDIADTFFEVGTYFNNNYPDDKINSNLKPDIAKFFPDLTTQQLYDRETLIRNSIKIFRWSKEKIAEIKAKFLAPDVPVLTYKDSDYEVPEKQPYVDVGKDNTLITTDIKKVLSYSSDPKEVESYQAFRKRKEDTSKIEAAFPQIARLKRIYEKIEIKKLPFYGLIYADPKTNGEGISPWLEQNHVKIRLATEVSRLEQNPQIRGVIHFMLDEDWRLLAFAHGHFPSLKVNFSHSRNLKDCSIFNPVPHRTLFDDGDLITYAGNFAVPFICSVPDTKAPADIKADVSFSLCNSEKKCLTGETAPELQILPGNGFNTTMQNFITQSFTHLPDTTEENIVFRDVSIETNRQSPSGQTLRLIADGKDSFDRPEFFIRTTEENIAFGRPRIAIDGSRVSARIDIITPDSSLIGKNIEITVLTNRSHVYRFDKKVTSSSIFDINSTRLTVGLLLLAVLGGFLLNFMPCVFPVLSLKILSLTRFGAKNTAHVKTSFSLSALGIFTGFSVLAAVLSVLKIMGQNLGWGMQFQNPLFLTAMIFAILMFLAQLYGIMPFSISFGKLGAKRFSPPVEAFFSGILVVIMATPCTGPYLGTTVGFALAGTPFDIFAILSAVALGLSLPYLLLLLSPDLSVFVPRPGPWMQKLHRFMSFMLLLTLVWLFSILLAQSSWLTTCGISLTALVFYISLYLYRRILAEAEISSDGTTEHNRRIRRVLHIICSSVLIVLFGLALIIGSAGFANHQKNIAGQSSTELDFNRIGDYVEAGENVLVKIGADWCLTCGYNNLLVFNNLSAKELYERYKVRMINIDWTGYNPEILDFMSGYGRRGLPFYILYNKNIPEGLVLPEILNLMEFEKILHNTGVISAQTD